MPRKPWRAASAPPIPPPVKRSLWYRAAGSDSLNSKRIAVRFPDELQGVRAHYGCSFDLSAHNYPDQVKSEHELEDLVKSLLTETEAWHAPEEVPVAG